MESFTKSCADVQKEVNILVGAYESFMTLAITDLKEKLMTFKFGEVRKLHMTWKLSRMLKAHTRHMERVKAAIAELEKLGEVLEPEQYIEHYMRIRLLVSPYFAKHRVTFQTLNAQLSTLMFKRKVA